MTSELKKCWHVECASGIFVRPRKREYLWTRMTKEKQEKLFNAICCRAFLEFVISFHVFVWHLTIQLVRIADTHIQTHRPIHSVAISIYGQICGKQFMQIFSAEWHILSIMAWLVAPSRHQSSLHWFLLSNYKFSVSFVWKMQMAWQRHHSHKQKRKSQHGMTHNIQFSS